MTGKNNGDWFFVVSLTAVLLVVGGIEYIGVEISLRPGITLLLAISPYLTLALMVYVAWVWVPRKVETSNGPPAS